MRLAGARRAQRSRSAAAWRVRRHASPGPQTRARWRRPHPIHFASAVRAGSAGSPALATRLRRRAHARRIAWPIARRNGSRAPPPHTRRPTRIRRRCCAKQGREGDGESGGGCGVGGGEFEAGGVSDRSMRWHGSARRGQRRGTAPGAAATHRGAAGVPREQTRPPPKKKNWGGPRRAAELARAPSRPQARAARASAPRNRRRGAHLNVFCCVAAPWRAEAGPRAAGGARPACRPRPSARASVSPQLAFFLFFLGEKGPNVRGEKVGGWGRGSRERRRARTLARTP